MSASNCGNLGRMAGRCEPVVNRGADAATLHGRLARTMVAGDQENDPLALSDCIFKTPVDCCPSRFQIHPVKIKHSVRLD